MIGYLAWENEPVGIPAFRSIAIIDGMIHASQVASCIADLYARFEALFGEAANETSYNFPGYTGKIRRATPRLLEAARAFLEKDGETASGAGLRRYGHALSDYPHPGLPFFGVEQRHDLFFLEAALPQEGDEWADFGEAMNAALKAMPTISAVMGKGMFVPPHHSSLNFLPVMGVDQRRAALGTNADMAQEALRREGSSHRWKEGEEPGIIDIGWRTYIGPDYWDRAEPGLASLAEEPGVTIERTEDLLIITAGEEPIWGLPEEEDALRPYSAVARALKPIRQPLSAARAFWFGGGVIEDHDTLVADYLTRLD
ncbi:DUF3396 domain-containing protein [Sphingomonas sp. HF-S4]|uniref:DUF3396 domain-containing protein n=1 Tax=Sphingomonas agrestis TaxID=3080540 RepID=A0ABU3Y1T9_9SPHN|nr:type VI immunity family protein [Sphingomonas sp. HF-S4]MDV3455355.1 DUF3396 domain-containing protein [Sphingomonas sp. HF-S4]